MKIKKGLIAVVVTGLGLLIGSAQAQDMTFFRIGTGGAGGTYYPIGGLIANAISNPPGSRACDKGGSCGVPGLVAIAVSTTPDMAITEPFNARAGVPPLGICELVKYPKLISPLASTSPKLRPLPVPKKYTESAI